MTDRHSGYIVTLADEVRKDEDETLAALRMIKGVISVTPVINSPEIHIARARMTRDMERRIWDAFNETRRSIT